MGKADYYIVRQTSDGEERTFLKPHVHAQFVRTAGIGNADGAGADFYEIVTAVFTRYGDFVGLGNRIQVDSVNQCAVPVNMGGEAVCLLQGREQENKNKAENKYNSQ